MNQKELKELIEFLIEKDIAEFELERGDVKVRVKRASQGSAFAQPLPVPPLGGAVPAPPIAPPAPVVAPGASPSASPAEDAALHVVKSPIVGTYFESPAPGSPPFVKPGDQVKEGQVLCI